ncbi:hypothetical protein OPKNFCMD_1463 [Methylobacterium crusticola]|uniref:Uncharacterized protein n=1 Tax=Methylobacterium crusticola TaxID=1697972 RepID=A0ABQ4QVM7_9HYPH|nr:hypothetical protein [Methylobacterium crusticola]GJD48739.1 hypothetical protein OPKNFCMD_1463 [Methylobacterium crusticola]
MTPTRLVGLAAALALLPALAEAQGGASGPVDLCRELVAFVRPKPADAPAGGPAAQPNVAVQAPAAQGSGPPQPSSAAGEAQQKSGLSGPVPQAGPGASGPQGQGQAGAQAAPAGPPPPPGPSPGQVAQVEAAAGANDPVACRAAAQSLRRAGVAMPAPLLALAALDPRFLAPAR